MMVAAISNEMKVLIVFVIAVLDLRIRKKSLKLYAYSKSENDISSYYKHGGID